MALAILYNTVRIHNIISDYVLYLRADNASVYGRYICMVITMTEGHSSTRPSLKPLHHRMYIVHLYMIVHVVCIATSLHCFASENGSAVAEHALCLNAANRPTACFKLCSTDFVYIIIINYRKRIIIIIVTITSRYVYTV